MYPATKFLSANDVAILNKDAKKLELAKKISFIVLPIVTVLCLLSWYFWFYGVVIFLSTGLTIMFTVVLFVSIQQGKNILKDLEENCKIVEHFILEKRSIISNERRRKVMISADYEDYLQRVAKYKEEIINKLDKPSFMQRDSMYDATLRYSFRFLVKGLDKEPQEFIIPIQYFIKFKDGDNITLEYAQHSKKVLHIL